MKVRDRILTLTDLFLGALYADRRCIDSEKRAVRKLLKELIVMPELPEEIERRITAFDYASFDLRKVAADFVSDPPMQRRRLLELVAQLCLADGEYDFEEDEYLRSLARALGMVPAEYEDLVLDYEIDEMRHSFEQLRRSQVPAAP